MARVGVLLSGCGVFDGSEIHESVFTLYELARAGAEVVCMAPDAPQLHVINHLTGDVTSEQRNVLVESARIARGSIQSITDVDPSTLDALVMPGGFGTAKNHTTWAVRGPQSEIREDVSSLIQYMVNASKPVLALCMAPTTVAKALEGTSRHPQLTVGTPKEASPYDIQGISEGLESIGALVHYSNIHEITIDATNHLISAPAYMMEASIVEVHENIAKAISALMAMMEPE